MTVKDTITVNQLCERALEADMSPETRRIHASALRVLRFGYRVEPRAYAVARLLAGDVGVSVPSEADCRVDDGHLVLFEGYGDIPAEALAADDVSKVCRWVRLRTLVSQTQDGPHRSGRGRRPLAMSGDAAIERTLDAIRIIWGFPEDVHVVGDNPVRHRRLAWSTSVPRALSEYELARSYAVTSRVMPDALFTLLLTFMLQSGALREAALTLTRQDLLALPGMVRLTRKGGSPYCVPILQPLHAEILDLAASRGAADADDKVFLVECGDTDEGYVPLTSRMIDVWCRRLSAELDLDIGWSPHLLRQTLAARLATVATPQVCKAFLGYETTETAQCLHPATESDMRRALEQLFAPVP